MVVRATTTLTNVGTAAGPLAAIRDVAQFLVGHLPRLAGVGAATLAETTIAYRNSTLAVQHSAHRHATARAGDYAPDPDGLLRPDGAPVTVEDLLTRPGMLLLVRSPGDLGALRAALGDLGAVVRVAPTADSGDGVVDRDDVLGRAYGWRTEGMALIRPDGYLGLIANSADPAVLRDYLTDTLRLTQLATV